MGSILKIGHRGAMGYAPENTLLSVEAAIKCGADIIEIDVQQCASGEMVVFHDRKVDRTTNGTGFVKQLTLPQLRALDAGSGQHIPTLEETLALINRRCRVNIEIKDHRLVEPIHQLIEQYVRHSQWQYDDFLISSFNQYTLRAFTKLNPRLPKGALILGISLGYAEFAKKVSATSVHPSSEFITEDFVHDAHHRGLKVYVWTVNDPDEIAEMKALNVDGIISDYPDRL